jgi:hypothetical protein
MERFHMPEEDFDLIRRRFGPFRLSFANRSNVEMPTELAEYDHGMTQKLLTAVQMAPSSRHEKRISHLSVHWCQLSLLTEP